ncbi:hypothetical protein CVT24_002514 [Panaeolus cyanescens]|uniref:DUF6534 domain-containing protein n=1 Tax=Panaeolus cyanescens TaxID=181874 RepID=A0A409YTK0_9AGAR|nr:hypothetical protein CVT24_002514 [Panaeolus cyanescens]
MSHKFDNTLGVAFVGVVIAGILHGVSLVQTFYYYTNQKDKWPIKTLVGFVSLFDTVHQALITHTMYQYLVTGWGDSHMLGKLVWSIIVEVLFNGLTALLVQSFLTMRVWRLSGKNFWLTALAGSLVIAEFTCILVYTALAIQIPTLSGLMSLKPLSISVNVLAAAGDVLIAVTLCTLLHRCRTGFQRSDTMINKLISVAGDTFIYIAFFFCIGRLYTNSLLATLNARNMIRGTSDMINSTSDHLPHSLRDFPKSQVSSSRHRPANISIKIDTMTEFAADAGRYNDRDNSESVDARDTKHMV